LPTSDIVREAVLGANGVAEGAAKGLIVADASTSRPEDSEKLGAELAQRGIRFLDACVSGTSAMAWKKDLIVIAGGTPEDFDASKPLFEGFSRAAYRMGPVGSGAMTKLIINLILFGNRMALAEGLVLGMKAGMAGESLLQVLQDAACSSKTMIDKGPKMLNGDYSPEGLVRISLKDARLTLEQGTRLGAPMLMTSLWTQLQHAAYQQGLAEMDSVQTRVRRRRALTAAIDRAHTVRASREVASVTAACVARIAAALRNPVRSPLTFPGRTPCARLSFCYSLPCSHSV
jgi:3-hydroxyisobutyrate dehydrogenase-like beta-hydroxyacid dehydrogenase